MNDEELKNREALAAFIGDAPFTRPGEPPEPADLERARAKRRRVARQPVEPMIEDQVEDPVETAIRAAVLDRATTAAELLERGDPPPRRWLVENFLPAGETAVLIGAGASGKGHTLQHLSLMLTSGPSFAGFRIEQPVRVLFVSLEDGLDELHRRLHAAVEERGYLGADNRWREKMADITFVDLRGVSASSVALTDERLLDPIAEKATAMGAGLIIIDPIGRALGDIELNAQSGGGRIHSAADNLVRRTGATVLLVHHLSKHGRIKGGPDIGAGASSGSHLIEDLARVVFRLMPLTKKEASAYDLDAPALELTVPKANFSPPLEEPIIFTRRRGGALRYEPGASPKRRFIDDVFAVLAAAPDGLDRVEWQRLSREMHDVGRPKFEEAKRTLLEAGRVELRGTTRPDGKAGRDVFFALGTA